MHDAAAEREWAGTMTFERIVCTLVVCYWAARAAIWLADVVYEARQPPGALRRCYDDDGGPPCTDSRNSSSASC